MNAVEGAVYTYKKPVQPTSFEQMMKVIKKCQELSEMNVVHEPMSSNNINSTELQSFWTAIIPGKLLAFAFQKFLFNFELVLFKVQNGVA